MSPETNCSSREANIAQSIRSTSIRKTQTTGIGHTHRTWRQRIAMQQPKLGELPVRYAGAGTTGAQGHVESGVGALLARRDREAVWVLHSSLNQRLLSQTLKKRYQCNHRHPDNGLHSWHNQTRLKLCGTTTPNCTAPQSPHYTSCTTQCKLHQHSEYGQGSPA